METQNAEIPGHATGVRHSKNKMAHFFSTYDLGSPESGSKLAIKKKKKPVINRKKNNFSVLRRDSQDSTLVVNDNHLTKRRFSHDGRKPK